VAVQQHVSSPHGAPVPGISMKISGVRPFQPHHLDLHAGDRLRARPALHQLDRLVHVAVLAQSASNIGDLLGMRM
jgi:hypothetical protein